MKDNYKEPMIIEFSNVVARVYSPILDEHEKEKRMQAVHRATAGIFKGVEK